MIRTVRLYREYRRQGLRHAWRYAGMWSAVVPVLKYLAISAIAVSLWIISSRHAEAINDAADNRVAAKISNQASYIKALERIIDACLGDQEGALFIDGQLHLCKAVPTGVRQ